MLAPTAETRRELSTAADDCVSSGAVAWSRLPATPRRRRGGSLNQSSAPTESPTTKGGTPPDAIFDTGGGKAQAMDPGETTEALNMGMRVTCRESAASSGRSSASTGMRSGATPPPMHVHPHQEERITVVSGSVRSRSGAADRVLSPGDTVVSPPGEPHTVGPAGNEDVEMVAELRPALSLRAIHRAQLRAGPGRPRERQGRGNPLRMATAKPHEAEFFLPRIPITLQRALLRAIDWLGRRLPGPRG